MSLRHLCLRGFSSLFLCICIGLVAVFSAAKPTTAQNPKLTVDVDAETSKISPFVYGINHGPWAPVELDMLKTAAQSGITYLRFPAGEWGDQNNLTPFHIDLFMDFAKLLKAEVSITVRLREGTPEAAAELVRYVNVEKKYGVRYWSVGNEPNLFPDYTVEQYVKDWRKIAEAMLAVDPTIMLVGPDISQYPPPDEESEDDDIYRNWLTEFLKANGDMVKIVSVHRYPFPKSMTAESTKISELSESVKEWDAIIPDIRKVIQETTNGDLPVAVTEVNSHWSKSSNGEATPDSHFNAVWWADVLGRLIRQKVELVAFWTLSTSLDLGTHGILAAYDTRPTYFVYQLYKQFGNELVESESTDDEVTITAARREDGTLTLMVVNRAVEAKSLDLELSGFTPGEAELWLLDPEHKAEKVEAPDLSSKTLELPAQSVSLYIVKPS